MRIIKPTENNSKIIPIPEDLNQAIFLAGPCQRVLNDGKIKYPVDWRNNAFNYLVLVPRQGAEVAHSTQHRRC